MIGKLVGPVVALFFTTMGGFVVLAVLVYFGNHGGQAGSAAVRDLTDQAIGLSTSLIQAVVDLAQAIFGALMDAIQ